MINFIEVRQPEIIRNYGDDLIVSVLGVQITNNPTFVIYENEKGVFIDISAWFAYRAIINESIYYSTTYIACYLVERDTKEVTMEHISQIIQDFECRFYNEIRTHELVRFTPDDFILKSLTAGATEQDPFAQSILKALHNYHQK